MRKIFNAWLLLFLAVGAVSLVSCEKDGPQRHIPHITILYSAGANNLGKSMDQNIDEITAHYLPARYEDNKVIVVSQRRDDSHHLESAVLTSLYRDDNTGAVKTEAIAKLPVTFNIADNDGFVGVMKYISKKFPAARYTMIFSSHGSGWIPVNYNADSYWEILSTAKSVGDSDIRDPQSGRSYHTAIDIRGLADRSPVHFDCIVFDACLMGTVEVAYELRNLTDKMILSAAEIDIEGIDYNTTLRRLLAYDTPDYDGICKDYIEKYKDNGRLSTIAMVECSTLPALAELCRDIFNRYAFDGESYVKDYYNYCFCDFYSLALAANLSTDDLASLKKQVEKSVPYRYCNNWDLSQEYFYGLAIFNPYYTYKNFIPFTGSGQPSVNVGTYYKTLQWNKDTGLVK